MHYRIRMNMHSMNLIYMRVYAVGLSIFTVVSSYQVPVLLQRGRSVDSLESLLESGIRFFRYSIAVEVVTLMF